MSRSGVITRISNPNINSGTAILMNVSSITETQSIFTNIKDKPNGSLAPVWDSQLQDFKNTGFGNPEFQLTGVIDLLTDHNTGATAAFDREYKNLFAQYSYSNFILYDDLFVTSANLTGSVTVAVGNCTINRSNDSQNGHFVTYTLTLREVPQ